MDRKNADFRADGPCVRSASQGDHLGDLFNHAMQMKGRDERHIDALARE